MDIQEIIQKAESGENVMGQLQQKSITVPPWGELVKQFDPTQHPVTDEGAYPDITVYEERESTEKDEFGQPKIIKVATGVEKVSRVTYALQELAVKRTTELCFGIPVKRIYSPENEKQQEIAKYMEKIYQRNHIDSVNIDRGRKLFASCEVITLWYAVQDENSIYGFKSKLKLRCTSYSPMQGDSLYPLFDEMGDLVALSVKYTRKVEDKDVTFFDTYTADKHLRWSNEKSVSMTLDLDEDIQIGKIPALYIYRPTSVWENTSSLVYEMEWAVSRNGNYLRKNSRPILAAMMSEDMAFGKSPATDKAFRDVVQMPQGSQLQYVTWNQAIDNLRFYVNELRQMFFTQLQLPDMSYENMKTTPMSGEARKQLFIDCHLKVKDESGRWLEFFEREANVIKAYLKIMLPPNYSQDIDDLPVEHVITPYVITSKADDLAIYINATGGKQLMAQSTAIQQLGMVDNVDEELQKIQAEGMQDLLAGAMAE